MSVDKLEIITSSDKGYYQYQVHKTHFVSEELIAYLERNKVTNYMNQNHCTSYSAHPIKDADMILCMSIEVNYIRQHVPTYKEINIVDEWWQRQTEPPGTKY